jgi:hypothetical protein
MFPNFPNLAEAIAAERAADFQREAAQHRRAQGRRMLPRRARHWTAPDRLARRAQQPVSPLVGTASRESCATSRAI